MSWVNDLASGLGIPAGAATVAVAMYAACAAAEKAARPEALHDIGKVLRNSSWSHSVRPSAVIERVFVWTFGDRHLTPKALCSSALATIVMLSLVLLVASSHHSILIRFFFSEGLYGDPNIRFQTMIDLILIGFLADYLSLGKARWFIRSISRSSNVVVVASLAVGDLLCSMAISATMSAMAFLLNFAWLHGKPEVWMATEPVLELADIGNAVMGKKDNLHAGDLTILAPSTLLTSIWTLLILFPTAVLKVLFPLQRFTSWFFDVDNHPVKAIGIVAATLVMFGGLIWSTLRAII